MELFRTFTTRGALWASVVRESVPGFLRLSEWQLGLLLFSTHLELMIQYFHCLLPDSSREEGMVDIQLSQNSCWKFHLVMPLLEDALNKSPWRRSILPAPLFPFVAFSGTSFYGWQMPKELIVIYSVPLYFISNICWGQEKEFLWFTDDSRIS